MFATRSQQHAAEKSKAAVRRFGAFVGVTCVSVWPRILFEQSLFFQCVAIVTNVRMFYIAGKLRVVTFNCREMAGHADLLKR